MVETVTQIKSGILINVGVSPKIWKNIMYDKRLYLESCYPYLWNGKYLVNIVDNSVMMKL